MDTDLLDQWATAIAQEAAPDEVYDASLIAIAFARGGKERKKLFRQTSGSEAGGSGLLDVTHMLLPYIFQALVISGPVIYKVLATNEIDAGKSLKEVYDHMLKQREHKTTKDQPATPAPAPANQAGTQDEQSRMIRAQIEEIMKTMRFQMAPSGADPEVLEDKSYSTLVVLFKKPQDAAKFIDQLGKKK